MTARPVNRGLIYLRRSSDKQEISLPAQLTWALDQAQGRGVKVDATQADVDLMQTSVLQSFKSIRLDDAITGADLERPGLRALVKDAVADPTISHIFAYRRDRLARPQDAFEMAMLERQVRTQGVTIVLSNLVAPPFEPGEATLSDDLMTLVEYYQSGEQLRVLAERILTAQQYLARAGFRTGGNAPYGFVRVLVDAQGNELEELPQGKRVRQFGSHVRLKPKDAAKLAVWCMILDLKHQGWGGQRIARWLTEQGIPSPNAGAVRRRKGIPYVVPEAWNSTTVLELCRNATILGIQVYGRRSEGHHRRLGTEGPRVLSDADRSNGRPKIIMNDEAKLIRSENVGPQSYDKEKWHEIQQQLTERGASQRGIPRAKDLGKYPLSCRVVDLSDGCGAPMYGRPRGKQRLLACSRYMKSAGAACENNTVDAEALLRLTLQSVGQILTVGERRGQLLHLFKQFACEERTSIESGEKASELASIVARCNRLRADCETAGRRMAVERDDQRYEMIAREYTRLRNELAVAEEAAASQQRQRDQGSIDVDEQVERAMSLVDDLARIARDDGARAELPHLFDRLGLRIGLRFAAGRKGPKRVVRRLVGGIIAFGDADLSLTGPGSRRIEPTNNQPALPPVGGAAAERTTPNGPAESHGGMSPPAAAPECDEEEISFTKVNRGDTI